MSDVASLLPPNATPLEKAIEQATARVGGVPVAGGALWDPMHCPAGLLPWLAWALAVEDWDPTWPELYKRQVIAASPAVHRKKGTRLAVEAALAAVDYPISIVEWFEDTPVADPFTFRAEVVVTDRGISTPVEDEIRALIDSSKNERSHLSSLTLLSRLVGSAGAAGTPRSILSFTILPGP